MISVPKKPSIVRIIGAIVADGASRRRLPRKP
jgi:hypothetical protein